LNLSNTTIDPIKLAKILSNLKNQKIENVIMEASSHGLKQNRLDGLKFNSGIFTNLSQDHLDYHKNLKNYLNAKLYLFENLISRKGNVITDKLIPEFKNIKKIAINKKLKLHTLNDDKNNLKLLSHNFKGEGQFLRFKLNSSIRDINLNLIGKIQLKNVLMAIIAAKYSGISLDKLLNTIPKLKPVEGRFEKIGKIKNQSKVILDYAHTPDGLKKVLQSIKKLCEGKLITVFGCGGDRDRSKRPLMGSIAEEFSDQLFITSDNPRSEEPQKIINDILMGIKKREKITVEIDRFKAINESIKFANKEDIVLIAGKGHEDYQILNDKVINFDDRKIAYKLLKEKSKSQ